MVIFWSFLDLSFSQYRMCKHIPELTLGFQFFLPSLSIVHFSRCSHCQNLHSLRCDSFIIIPHSRLYCQYGNVNKVSFRFLLFVVQVAGSGCFYLQNSLFIFKNVGIWKIFMWKRWFSCFGWGRFLCEKDSFLGVAPPPTPSPQAGRGLVWGGASPPGSPFLRGFAPLPPTIANKSPSPFSP